MGQRRRVTRSFTAAMALMLLASASPVGTPTASAAALPSGFQETVVFSGLVNPTDVQFAADGRVFVAEKSGTIKVFDSLSDTTPDTFADLRHQRPRLLGSRPARARARPGLSRRIPTSTSCTPTTTSSATRPGAALGRHLPDTARRDDGRLRRQRAAVAAPGGGQRR